MSALSPLVNFFQKRNIPKTLGISLTYIIIILAIIGILASVVPTLIEQSNKLINILPPLLGQLFDSPYIDKNIFQSGLATLSKNAFSITLGIFNNFLSIIFLLVLTFYLLLEKENLETRTALLFGNKQERVKKLIVNIEEKLGSWLRGQLFLSVLIAALTYIGLIILGIPFALPFAILAGMLEVVPVMGPIIASIPPIIIALTISPVLAIGVAVMFLVIQQAESSIIVPQVMKKAVGLNALMVILAIAIGGRLLGITGAIIAVPIAVVLQIVATEIIESKNA